MQVDTSTARSRYLAVAGGFTDRLRGAEASLTAPSPCTGWSAGDVAQHVVDTHDRIASKVGRQRAGAGSVAGSFSELVTDWDDARSSILAALDDPLAAETPVSSRFGDMSFAGLVATTLCTDTILHTWDLARATGQDETLDASGVVAAQKFLESVDHIIRFPGGFEQAIPPAPDHDQQTRLLRFAGRTS